MLEQHRKDFEQLSELYAKAKRLVLEAEGKDPEQKSNIAVLNEMRAALDHLMQCIGSELAEEPDNKSYIENQIRKAREHIVRAMYDSLDGIGVSIHKRTSDMLRNSPEHLIATVFPEYHSDYLPKINSLDEKIIESRNNRDSRGSNSEEKIKEYQDIIREMEQVYEKIVPNLRYIADYNELLCFDVKMKRFSQDKINEKYPQYSEYNKLTAELRKMFKQRTFKVEKDKYEELVKKMNYMQGELEALFPEEW
ncbi:MAG: hypothetical protein LBB36_05595 [Fibromonadaceae bacterium]|jgi:hypothetical protein|nr:hypothetical protein [Fibromonadaceae bacterium]